jgi:RES domain-containing protein
MLAEPELTTALNGIRPQTVHGFYSRFVEFRHLGTTSPHPAPDPRPLWDLGSKLYGGRFTPKGAFEAIYLAEDPVTAMAEVTGVLYSPQAPMPLKAQPPLVLITVEGILLRVLDLTASGVQSVLGTNGQELTGAWRHIQATGQEAPTQILGRVCHQSGRFEAVRFPSSKSTPHGVCIAVFTDRLQSPSLIKVFDPHGRLRQQLP